MSKSKEFPEPLGGDYLNLAKTEVNYSLISWIHWAIEIMPDKLRSLEAGFGTEKVAMATLELYKWNYKLT